jgi:hypothetical protein
LEIAFCDPDQKWEKGAGWIAAKEGHFRIAMGNNFHIPPGNTYRLRNHSTTTPASLSWVIVGHGVQAKPDEENDKEEEKETIDFAARRSMARRRLCNDNPSGVDYAARHRMACRRFRNDNPSGEPTGEPTNTLSDKPDKPDEPPVDEGRNAEANEEAGNHRRDVLEDINGGKRGMWINLEDHKSILDALYKAYVAHEKNLAPVQSYTPNLLHTTLQCSGFPSKVISSMETQEI